MHVIVRHGKWKLVNHVNASERKEAPPWSPELYDLKLDPYEQSDLSAVFPPEVERLSEIYHEWFKDVGADIPDVNRTWHRWDRYGERS